MNRLLRVRDKINKKRIYYYFLILTLSLCFQTVSIIDFGGFALKPYHVIAIIGLLPIIKKQKINFPNLGLVLFFLYSAIVSIVSYQIYGFNGLLFNYVFGFILMLNIMNNGSKISRQEWLRIGKIVGSTMLFLTFIRFVFNIQTIVTYLLSAKMNGHIGTIIGTFFGGGSNLEATWLALFGFFFFDSKKGIIYALLSIVVSLVFSSRTGIIIDVALLLFILFQKESIRQKIKPSRIIGMLALTAIFLVVLNKLGLLDYIVNRFVNAGSNDDNGMSGRKQMWQYILLAFSNNPLGYGLGNAINGLKLISNHSFIENNIHNIYAQMLLDIGLPGFIFYLSLIIVFLKKEFKNFFKNPFVAYIIVYFVAGLAQFRGGDVLFFFVLSIYLTERSNYRRNVDVKN